MLELPTFDALYDVGKSEVQSRNPDLTDWTEGSNNDAVIGAGAALADQVLRYVIDRLSAYYLDTAEDDDLDAVIADRYPDMEPRKAAVGSTVALTFTRGASTGALTIPSGTTCRASVNGRSLSFTTNAEAVMASVDDTVDVVATCTTTGPTGNVAEGTITTIVDAIPGDATATVTNAERAVGGDDQEDDDAFRARGLRYHATLRKGTVAALELGALSVPGVRCATVDESYIDPDDGGYVAVYVGDPDARGNDALAARVETELNDVRAAGVWVQVFAAERQEIEISLTLYLRKGADSAALVTAARAAVLAYVNGLSPAATMYVSQLEAAACAVSTDVLGCVVTAPTEDKTPVDSYKAVRVQETDLSVSTEEIS